MNKIALKDRTYKIDEKDWIITPISDIKVTYQVRPTCLKAIVRSSKNIYDYIIPLWPDIHYYESAAILLLNRANRILGCRIIGQGGLTGTVVDPRIVLQNALLMNASEVVLIHNHPSGGLIPSQADKDLTNKIKEGAKLIDVVIMDHLIITSDGYYSFADEGLI